MMQGCASTGSKSALDSAKSMPQANSVVSGGHVVLIRGEGSEYYFDQSGVYSYYETGLQKRPFLIEVASGEKLSGQGALSKKSTLLTLRQSSSGLVDAAGYCAESYVCKIDAIHHNGFVFSFLNGKLAEVISLGLAEFRNGSKLSELVGSEAYYAVRQKELIGLARSSGVSDRVDSLVQELGDKADYKQLYFVNKSSKKFRDLYIHSLRSGNSYVEYQLAFGLSGSKKDVDGMFEKRSEHLERFVDFLESASGSELDLSDYFRAVDVAEVVGRREIERKLAAEKAEERRVALEAKKKEEKERLEKKRKALIAKKRQEVAARKANIGNVMSFTHSKRISTDDCAGLFGIDLFCLWVTYKYNLEGEIVAVNEGEGSYAVRVDSQELYVPSFVSFKWKQLQDRAEGYGAGLIGRKLSVGF